jgi:hypothetical protein
MSVAWNVYHNVFTGCERIVAVVTIPSYISFLNAEFGWV